MPTFNTLADFPPERFSITAYCDACGHSQEVDIAKLPNDLPIPVFRANARCTECGAKGASLTIGYTASMDASCMIGKG